jgi:hypothetical protein
MLCALTIGSANAQINLTHQQAIHAIYGDYDAATKTSAWSCPQSIGSHPEDCLWGNNELERVSVQVIFSTQIEEGDVFRTYVVTSAIPFQLAGDKYDCHACAPEIGIGIFLFKDGDWHVESKNSAALAYGAWGEPNDDISVVKIGRSLYALMFTRTDGGQGYLATNSWLLAADKENIETIWQFQDNENNDGAYDPSDKYADQVHASVSAAYRFVITDATPPDHYDIELISRGFSEDVRKLKPQNWTEIYRFKAGKYQLVSHREYRESAMRITKK